MSMEIALKVILAQNIDRDRKEPWIWEITQRK